MKKFFPYLLVLLTGCFPGGNHPQEVSVDIEYKQFKKQTYYADCVIKYPEVQLSGNADNTLNDSLNSAVKRWKSGFEGNALSQKQKEVDRMIDDAGQGKEGNQTKYVFEATGKVNQSDNYINVFFEIYEYALGAHGATYYQAYTYDVAEGKMVTLGNVLNLNSSDNRRKLREAVSGKVQLDDYCEIPKIEPYFKAFIVEEDKIGFAFGSYELGAYSCGSEIVYLEKDQLKAIGLLKPGPAI